MTGSERHLSARYTSGATATGLFLAGLAALIATTFGTIEPLKYAIGAAVMEGTPLGEAALSAFHAIRPINYAAPLAAAILLLATLVVELRSRSLSRAITGNSRALRPLLLAALLLWFSHSYLLHGFFVTGDSGAHVAEVARRAAALADGSYLYWSNFTFLGQPVPQYYAPITYTIVTGLAALSDATWAFKAMLLASHVASGYAAYWLARSLAASSLGAFFCAVVYAGAYAHIHLMLQRGSIQLALNFVLLPAALACAARAARDPRLFSASWLGLALASAALVANHAPNGIYSGFFIAAFCLALTLFERARIGALWVLASAGVAALALAAFSWAPPLASSGTAFEQVARPLYLELPGWDYFSSLILWRNTRASYGSVWGAYLGLTAIALAFAAVLLRRRLNGASQKAIWIVAGLLVLSLFLRGSYVRDIILTLTFLAILAGFGAEALAGLGRRWSAPGLLLAALFLDLGATAIQPVFRTDKQHLYDAGRFLEAHGELGRILLTDTRTGDIRAYMGSSAQPIHLRRADYVAGWANGMAGVVNNYLLAILHRAQRDLNEGGLTPQTAALLCMLRAGVVVNDDRTVMGLPESLRGTVEMGPLGRVLPISCGFDLVYSRRLVVQAPGAELDRPPLWGDDFRDDRDVERIAAVQAFIDRAAATMAVDAATGMAAAIPVRRLPSNAGGVAEASTGKATVSEYRVATDRIAISLAAPHDGFVRLAHAWWPGLRATINGSEVETIPGALGFLVLPVAEGDNRIEIRPEPPFAQVWANRFSLAVLGLIAVAMLANWRIERRAAAMEV